SACPTWARACAGARSPARLPRRSRTAPRSPGGRGRRRSSAGSPGRHRAARRRRPAPGPPPSRRRLRCSRCAGEWLVLQEEVEQGEGDQPEQKIIDRKSVVKGKGGDV